MRHRTGERQDSEKMPQRQTPCKPDWQEPSPPVGGRPGGPWRLLFLAPFAPRSDAPHGGARVLAQLLAALATRHRLGLVYLRDLDEPPIDPQLADRCEMLQEVFRSTRRRGLLGRVRYRTRVALSPLWGEPEWAAHCRVPEFGRRARELAIRWRPHLVQAEYHVMGRYLLELERLGTPRILSIYEPGAEAALERWRSGPRSWRGILDWQAWRRFERRVLARVDGVVVFTERDRRALAGAGVRTPIHTIPIGTTLPPGPLSPAGHGPPVALFIGSFDHPPNLDAAERLIDDIFPRVRKALPGAALHIVGGTPPDRIRRRAGPGVVFLGRVPDVTPHLDQAAVVVAPLRLGGGMRVKVLETLAAGKALVASSLAAEGLDLAAGPPLILADEDPEFATAVARLLAQPGLRADLASRARAWALEHLGWDRVIPRYDRLYQSLLSG